MSPATDATKLQLLLTSVSPQTSSILGTSILLTHSSQTLVKMINKALIGWELIIAEYAPSPVTSAPIVYNQEIVTAIKGIIEGHHIDLTKQVILIIESNLGHTGSENPVINLIQKLIDQVFISPEPTIIQPTQVLFFSGTTFHKEDFDKAISALSLLEPYARFTNRFTYIGKEESVVSAIKNLVAESAGLTSDTGILVTTHTPDTTSTPFVERRLAPVVPPPSTSWCCC